MTKFKFLFVLLITALMGVGCDPSDNETSSSGNFTENFGNTTSKDFLGQVVDEDNNPIQNAAINIGSSTAQTDANGIFIINGASVYEKFAYITAKKAGFIDGSRAMIPTSGSNNVKIMMLSGTVVATINSGASSQAVLSNGTKVTFDGNFKNETGTAYSGSVNVIMHHLDPADPNVGDKMPGMLFAESADGQAKVLETYGMMNVELRGSAGEKLQISNTAQIEMPITATQLASAPATIPLWHFDETLGYWKEEGSATKQGNKYVGTVSHFSWWNCDVQFVTVSLTITIVDANGNPLSNVGVVLTASSININSNIQFSNSNGQISGLIPANTTLTLNVYDSCGGVIYTASIGPFSVNTVLPNIVLGQSSTIAGALMKCDNTNVTNGYVRMDYGSRSFLSPVTNGDFSFNTLACGSNNNFTLTGYDFDNLQASDAINYTLTTPITNVGNLMTCNTITEYMSYQIDNNAAVYFIKGTPNIVVNNIYNNGHIGIVGREDPWGPRYFEIFLPNNLVGVYSTTNTTAWIDINHVILNSQIDFHLNHYGAIGEYIDITFDGTYTEGSANPVTHTITGSVHVIRIN